MESLSTILSYEYLYTHPIILLVLASVICICSVCIWNSSKTTPLSENNKDCPKNNCNSYILFSAFTSIIIAVIAYTLVNNGTIQIKKGFLPSMSSYQTLIPEN